MGASTGSNRLRPDRISEPRILAAPYRLPQAARVGVDFSPRTQHTISRPPRLATAYPPFPSQPWRRDFFPTMALDRNGFFSRTMQPPPSPQRAAPPAAARRGLEAPH